MTTIVQDGHPALRRKAVRVLQKEFGTPKLRTILSRMSGILAVTKHGVALAAPQIGEPLRIFIISGKVLAREQGQEEGPQKDLVFINPEILRVSRKRELMHEGCLSVDGVYGEVKRHTKTSVRAQDEHGKPFTYHGSGLMSQIFQHEIDHLEGILFTDLAESLEEARHEEAERV